MLDWIISYSLGNKLIVLLFTAAIIGTGIYSLLNLPIGAAKDVTNNQVQIIPLQTLEEGGFYLVKFSLERNLKTNHAQ